MSASNCESLPLSVEEGTEITTLSPVQSMDSDASLNAALAAVTDSVQQYVLSCQEASKLGILGTNRVSTDVRTSVVNAKPDVTTLQPESVNQELVSNLLPSVDCAKENSNKKKGFFARIFSKKK